jgi:hypothetical protein
MEFYSAIKKNEIMLFVGKWMELENFMLSKGWMYSIICGGQTCKLNVHIETHIIYIHTDTDTCSQRKNKLVLVSPSEGATECGREKESVR